MALINVKKDSFIPLVDSLHYMVITGGANVSSVTKSFTLGTSNSETLTNSQTLMYIFSLDGVSSVDLTNSGGSNFTAFLMKKDGTIQGTSATTGISTTGYDYLYILSVNTTASSKNMTVTLS